MGEWAMVVFVVGVGVAFAGMGILIAAMGLGEIDDIIERRKRRR